MYDQTKKTYLIYKISAVTEETLAEFEEKQKQAVRVSDMKQSGKNGFCDQLFLLCHFIWQFTYYLCFFASSVQDASCVALSISHHEKAGSL